MEEFLKLHNIYKSFVGVQALQGVDFSIFPGEIHCLVGANGSGKSTLIKIISGVHQPDSGAIIIEGTKVDHIGSINTISRGIQVIYQDLSLFPNLSVAENIAISEIEEEGRSLIDWREVKRIARAAIQRIGVKFDLDELVGELPIGRQQLVAICRALTKEVRLLILDEPTASLTQKDIDSLLSVVQDLQTHGIAVLFVSHKLSEVFAVAERITVLRDGKHVATLPSEELTNDKLVSLMTGRTIKETRFEYLGKEQRKLLEVRGLSKKRNFKDISFELYAGEILGIIGLIGSGRTELALALFGISTADSGEIRVEDEPVQIRSVQDAVKAGIAYVPENRLVEGLILKHSVADNTIAAILKNFIGRFHLIDPHVLRDKAEEWINVLKIQVADPGLAVQILSGGNQQRVVIAKWLAAKPKILILDSPTVGIDVMAKSDIHGLIRQLASEGLGVLLISDEISEVVNNSNRILLMRSGKIHAQLESKHTTAEEVQHLVEASK